jgi:hypothetical protein
MAPNEVAGLQAIAKAHGGSLTVNPHTGLAEAGFLSSILPTLAGAALASTGIGAPMAALMVGGGYGLAKGDLKAGLMAGLGAYGGAGLGGGLETMGSQAAGEQAGAQSLGTTPQAMATESGSQAALTTNPASNPQGFDSMGNTPSQTVQGGYDQATSGSYIDPAKAQTYADNYAQASQPSMANMGKGVGEAMNDPSKYIDAMGGGMQTAKYGLAAAGPAMMGSMGQKPPIPGVEHYNGPLSRYHMSEDYKPYDQQQPNPYYTPQYKTYAGGGAIEQMSDANAIGQNTGYPMADVNHAAYTTPWQTPVSENVVQGTADTGVNSMTGDENRFAFGGIAKLAEQVNGAGPGPDSQAMQLASDYQPYTQQFAAGGHLGGYSDGGRMLKGPGDGMSDSIPAKIGAKQPARLADGEFVVPADVVSHLGNGSSDAGAKQLYSMMDRIRAARTGKKKQAPQVNPGKAMPA